jgi:FkbM family methyltransferase
MKALQDKLHRLLAKSATAAWLAAKVRNQANSVIAYHLGETCDSHKNGEYAVVEHLAAQISTFVDVGANVGEWSAHMFQHTKAKGFLFEPSRSCVQRLKERFHENDAVIRDAAVSDQVGTAIFAQEDNCGEGSSLVDSSDTTKGNRTEVPITTLDAEFGNSALKIDYLKIDTEGYDLKVMRGAQETLSRTRFLQFEYNYFWVTVGSTLADAIRYLNQQGFTVFLIRSTGLHPLRYEVWNDFYRYSNFFACRAGDLESVRSLIRNPI